MLSKIENRFLCLFIEKHFQIPTSGVHEHPGRGDTARIADHGRLCSVDAAPGREGCGRSAGGSRQIVGGAQHGSGYKREDRGDRSRPQKLGGGRALRSGTASGKGGPTGGPCESARQTGSATSAIATSPDARLGDHEMPKAHRWLWQVAGHEEVAAGRRPKSRRYYYCVLSSGVS